MSCTSDPTQGCDNSEIVAAIESCCVETNANLSAISDKLTTINSTILACNTETQAKLTSIISLLTTIANA